MAEKIEVVRAGRTIAVPEGMPLKEAIQTLVRQEKYEEEPVGIEEIIEGCFWDGAYAFHKAMVQTFTWVHGKTIETFFGEIRPKLIAIETGWKKTENVPWGQFTVPGVEGTFQTQGHRMTDGRYAFKVVASVKRKYEKVVKEVADLARRIVRDQSIYRGKAVRIRFRTDEGKNIDMPAPKFMDVSQLDPNSLILSRTVDAAVRTSIFTPIAQTEVCRQHRVPLKRGVLMSGMFGTGKTLTAYMTAALCEKNGWTFIYCERADEFAECIRFAHSYQPAVVFCEDIDRVLEGNRDITMDDILNVVDGIESKHTEIMTVLTTNMANKINAAMLRPGRLDAVIDFLPPDAEAVERLLHYYARGLLEPGEDLSDAGKMLAGRIPAVIRECVERAKLSAIKLGVPKDGVLRLDGLALLDAAEGLEGQLALLEKNLAAASEVTLEDLVHMGLAKLGVAAGDTPDLKKLAQKVGELHEKVVGDD